MLFPVCCYRDWALLNPTERERGLSNLSWVHSRSALVSALSDRRRCHKSLSWSVSTCKWKFLFSIFVESCRLQQKQQQSCRNHCPTFWNFAPQEASESESKAHSCTYKAVTISKVNLHILESGSHQAILRDVQMTRNNASVWWLFSGAPLFQTEATTERNETNARISTDRMVLQQFKSYTMLGKCFQVSVTSQHRNPNLTIEVSVFPLTRSAQLMDLLS